jgi:hypothetical protein
VLVVHHVSPFECDVVARRQPVEVMRPLAPQVDNKESEFSPLSLTVGYWTLVLYAVGERLDSRYCGTALCRTLALDRVSILGRKVVDRGIIRRVFLRRLDQRLMLPKVANTYAS